MQISILNKNPTYFIRKTINNNNNNNKLINNTINLALVRVWDSSYPEYGQNTKASLSKSESVNFLLIESVICLFTDSPMKKYFSLLKQLIFTEVISEI